MTERIAARYRTFAAVEATGRSPLYVTFANKIADDPDILGFLATLPPPKQQPNLLKAMSRIAPHFMLRQMARMTRPKP